MIIIIGKKDRLNMKDIQAYIHNYGDIISKNTELSYESRQLINVDCQKLANRILKALGEKYRHQVPIIRNNKHGD